MSNPQAIQKLSIRHDAILEYLMANPKVRMQDVALHFGVTGGWLSQIVHSDIFQEKLRERTDTAFHHTVLPLREKMHIAATMALDKIIDGLPQDADMRTANDIATDMLDRLGFGAKPIGAPGGTNITNNQFVTINATRDEIAEARKMLEAKARPLGVGVTVDGESLPIALPAQSLAPERAAMPEGNFPFSPWKDGAGEAGDKVRGEST